MKSLGLKAVLLHVPRTGLAEQMIPYAVELGTKFIGIGMEILKNEKQV